MTDDRPGRMPSDGFPDYHDHEHRIRSIERWRVGANDDRETLRDRVRDLEENVRNLAADCAEWGPIIDAARDQEYLRNWIEKQEREEEKRRGIRWTHVLAVLTVAAAWTAGVTAIAALVLSHAGH